MTIHERVLELENENFKLRKALADIEEGLALVFDEGEEREVEVWMDADALRDIAREALAEMRSARSTNAPSTPGDEAGFMMVVEAERDAALNAIRNTIIALDAHGVCQTTADALRILTHRADTTGSILGRWPPRPTPNDEARIKPASQPSTPNDE